MNRVKIKDIEELNINKQQIIKLQKKIEELSEVKLLKEKRQQELELNKKIKELSTFDSNLIGDTIAKLMTKFEGILYQCVIINSCFENNYYLIKPKYNDSNIYCIYPNFKLKKINNDDIIGKKEKSSLTFLPPSEFISNYDSNKKAEEINIPYIQYFIDFLYNERSNNFLYEITNKDLEIILQKFLLITKDLQQQRKEEITRKIKERLIYEKRLKFEKSCLIDRKLIYNSLSYIINNYENNMIATQEYEKNWVRSSQWSELYGYHNLIVKSGNNKVCFKTEVDHEGCYPDEEYCGIYVNINKNTNICFFDFKKNITPIIKKSMFVEKFMNMIEDLYSKNISVSLDDIQQILVIISNDRKAQKRVLKKDKIL